uniref:Uncharacterized protein n=1 Tax=Eutreptiella gymnastica TaxID=73025 RepID=A0A7S4FVX1_9EUGL
MAPQNVSVSQNTPRASSAAPHQTHSQQPRCRFGFPSQPWNEYVLHKERKKVSPHLPQTTQGPLLVDWQAQDVFKDQAARLCAFGGAYWPLATAHSDPLWVRTCFGRVNGAPG